MSLTTSSGGTVSHSEPVNEQPTLQIRARKPTSSAKGRARTRRVRLRGVEIGRRQRVWLILSLVALLGVTIFYSLTVVGLEMATLATVGSEGSTAMALIGVVGLFCLTVLIKHEQLEGFRALEDRERQDLDAVEVRLTEVGGFFDAASLFGVDLNIERALRLISQQLARALSADLVAFLLPDDDGTLEIKACDGEQARLVAGVRVAVEDSTIARALRRGRVAVLGPRDLSTARTAEERSLAALGTVVAVRLPPLALSPVSKPNEGLPPTSTKPPANRTVSASGALLVSGALVLENESCRTALSLVSENLGSALSRLGREAAPMAANIQSVQGILAEQSRQMEVFLATATHELRAPLSGIVSYAEVLADYFDTLSDEERRSLCSALNQQCKALMGLVDELFDLARLRSGRLTLVASPTNARELVQSAIDLLSPVAAERGLHVECHIGEAGPVVLDSVKIRQCILNLLTNAIKYTPEGGTIRVELASDSDGIRVVVSDTGRGIPSEEIEKIFDLFHTGAARGDAKSLGLGLYLVKSFIELHGGRVWVRSTPGEGSTFAFTLPWSPPRTSLEVSETRAA